MPKRINQNDIVCVEYNEGVPVYSVERPWYNVEYFFSGSALRKHAYSNI